MSNFLEEKARFLGRSLAERVSEGGIPLDKVDTWQKYFTRNKEELERRSSNDIKKQFEIKEYEVNQNLNEKVSIWKGDITKLAIDAIVNAANNRMLGGEGVDGAIHRAAGKLLLAECKTKNGCETGDAKITGAYQLPSLNIIHTVGPRGEKPDLLRSAYKTSLEVAVENNLSSIAFPCISTGVYGYPQQNAAIQALGVVREFLEENPTKMERVIFCLFLPEDVKIYETLMQVFFPIDAPADPNSKI